MDIVVQKYGGSSLATLDNVQRIARLVAERHWSGRSTVVVVSARGNTTDKLLRLARELGGAPTARETDQLLATGECASAAQLAMALNSLDVPAVSLTGAQAGIIATGPHGSGRISAIRTERIVKLLSEGVVVVVAGFQGVRADGDVVTLGRGGSDTTAVALAGQLEATRCEIYTDVDGVYTADPRVVPTARILPAVDVGLMAEMAFAGAKVLHSRSVELAAMHSINLNVRSSFSQHPGTAIPGRSDEDMFESHGAVVAITHDTDVAKVSLRAAQCGTDLVADVLAILSHRSVPLDMVAAGGSREPSMGFTVRRSDVNEIRSPLQQHIASFGGDLHIEEGVGKLSLVGMGLLNRPEYTARMLSRLSTAGITASWISTSQLRTSVIVPLDRLVEAVGLLHQEFQRECDSLTDSMTAV
jgi:aspartate kinase